MRQGSRKVHGKGSSNSKQSCLACRFDRLSEVVNFGLLPISSQSLYSTPMPCSKVPYELYYCLSCGHLQNICATTIDADHYNKDYLFSVSHSDAARDLQSSIARMIQEFVSFTPQDTIIEVGCGDGYFLENLSSSGAKCLGFEPSASYQLAKGKERIEVHNRFYDPANDSADCKLLIYRHVLEHLLDPESFLKDCPAKYLYIEVPRADHLIANKMYSDFYNDHVSYFSKHSLTIFMQRLGYKIVSYDLAGDGEFLGVLAERSPEHICSGTVPEKWIDLLTDFADNFKDYKSTVKNLFTKIEKGASPLTVWGAGSRGITLLYHLDLKDKIDIIIDSDPNKLGRFVPGYDIPVGRTEDFLQNAAGTVVITSATFAEEIKNQIKREAKRSHGLNILTLYPPRLERLE